MKFDTKDIIEKEMDLLLNFFRVSFSKKYKCVLPLQLLKHTITCYVKDLDRLSVFHNIDCPDKHKQAAHLIYWINKIKPIHIIDGNNNYNRPSVPFINEIFAYYVGLSRLNISLYNISDKFLKNFLYTLHFRDSRPEPMYLFLYTIEQAIKKEAL